MELLNRAIHHPIGVDLGRDSLKLVQLRQRGSTLSVQAAAQVPLKADAALKPDERISRAIAELGVVSRQSGFHGRSIVLAIPREFLTIKTLRLPMLADYELGSAIELEAQNLFDTQPGAMTIRFLPAGEVRMGNESRMEVVVLAAETARVEAMLNSVYQAGLNVDALDFEPSLLYRCIERFTRRKEDENEVIVLVDIGSRSSQVVIGRGHEISFTKTIEIGSATLNQRVAQKLQISPDEAESLRRRFSEETPDPDFRDSVRQAVVDATRDTMASLSHEISLCLRYYSVTFRGQRPSRVRLMGGQAYDTMLRQALAGSLTVPIELYSPMAGVDLGNTVLAASNTSLSEWATAFGAALKRVRGDVSRHGESSRGMTSRRKTDTSIVEVVDLTTAIKTAGVMDTSEARLGVARA